jgi:hypothetical protein
MHILPPHHTISDVGLVASRLVKNSIRLSQQKACFLVPVHGQVRVIFYKSKRGPLLLLGDVLLAHHGILLSQPGA